MANMLYQGEDHTIEWENTTGAEVAAKKIVLLPTGNRVAFLLVTTPNGGKGAARLTGGVEYAKVTAEAWTQGQTIYYDAGVNKLTTTVGTNKIAGFAARAQGASDTTGRVWLDRV